MEISINISWVIYLSLMMFIIGLVGVMVKRNPLILFLSIELMLNASNLLFVGFADLWKNHVGHIFVFFVLVVAAAEAAVGLAIIINVFRSKQVIDIDSYNDLRG